MNYWNKQIGYIRTGNQFILNNITYPKNWLEHANDNELISLNIHKEPLYDSTIQILEKDPITGWIVRDKTQEDLDLEQDALDFRVEAQKESLINELWKKATEYEQTFISGSAPAKIGLLAYAGNLKADSISQWVEGIWADYYDRKSQVFAGNLSVSTDFSNNGPIPYTVWETIYGDQV